MDKLPDNIISLKTIRLNHGKTKKCTCRNRVFEVDYQNKEVTCGYCGEVVDPFEAILEIARRREHFKEEIDSLLEQRKQILNWKPHLLAVRELERIYRGGDMLPCCPHCGRGIEAKELTKAFTNRKMELERRKFDYRKTEGKG